MPLSQRSSRLLLSGSLICAQVMTHAQEPGEPKTEIQREPRNIFYGQAFGDMFLFGLNYERVLLGRTAVDLNGRIALGIVGDVGVALLGTALVIGTGDLKPELGFNVETVNSGGDPFLTGSLGLRYRKRATDGTFLRMAFNPVLYSVDDVSLLPIALGFGRVF